MQIFDYPIIDAHVHPYLNRNFASNGPKDWDEYFSELERAGINKICGSINIRNDGSSFDPVYSCNKQVMELYEQYPDKYFPGINIHPNFPEESRAELEAAYAKGVRWIGEIGAYVMGYTDYATPKMFSILEFACKHKMVLNIHPSSLEDMDKLLSRFPNLKIVIAHPKCVNEVMDNYKLLERHPNAYLDLSGGGLNKWGMLRAGIDMLGAERFLFGTDYPICNPAMYVQGVIFEHLSDAERKSVFHDNFLRLIGDI